MSCEHLIMQYSTFPKTPNNALLEPMFLGQPVNVARYDQQKYETFEKLIEKQISFFWRPEEVDLSRDRIDYANLPDHEKHIFISNLKYQTLLDSIQGRSPNVALLPVEKLSPPPEPPVQTETVVVEQAIYRCPKGKSYIYVDADKRKGYNRCTLFRAEKTEEVPVGSAPTTAAPTSGNPNNCSGTLQYKGSTYLFMEHQPCPIPDSVFQRLTPAATSR